MAKQVALPACSITMVPVKLLSQHIKAAIHLAAPEQRFGEYLIIPEGLYDHWPGLASVFRVLVVNERENSLLLDAGLPVAGELVKPDVLEVSTNPPQNLHTMGEPVEPPDMQQQWMDLELAENEFLQKV